MASLESLLLAHETLYGTAPSPKHVRIYEAFPGSHGVSSKELDEEVFEAALILAIVQTYPRHQRPTPFKCFLFVPAETHKWAVEQTSVCAKRMFAELKREKKVDIAKHLGTFFHAISMGCRILQLQEAPERWVSFGFDRSDLIPSWLRDSLLDIRS